VGKSTLFNAITSADAGVSNYPFCTIEPNRATVPVTDSRLDDLEKMVNPEKAIPAVIDFVDIAGLVKGAHKGEGLGNKFLSHIREVDAIVHVVRCFKDEDISHVSGNIDPISDIETIDLELIFADTQTINNRLEKVKRQVKTREREIVREVEVLTKLKPELEAGKPLRNLELSQEESQIVKSLFLLTDKPVLFAANISEDDIAKDAGDLEEVEKVKAHAREQGAVTMVISAKIEEELLQLEEEERAAFMEELGLSATGIDQLIKTSYELLDLISFFTIKLPEVRAWTVKKGTMAPQAGGKIHTDFERGFICAEVIDYPTLMDAGSLQTARESGLVRQEGKQYQIKDGDIVLFKFNV
jgi:GTP-binding protein YchF